MIGVELGNGSGPTRLHEVELADPGDPGPNEVRVRLHATSLNFHDNHVVNSSTAPGRIPMADGAGVVEAIGADVAEFREG